MREGEWEEGDMDIAGYAMEERCRGSVNGEV